jgi:transcription-repair coupling factor (superfamily II helicase)
VHVVLGVDAYIPSSYVPAERQRMEIYRRLSRSASAEDVKQLSADLADAYGPIPDIVRTMLDLAEVRVRAAGLRIESIILMDSDIVFTVRDFSRCDKLFRGAPGSVRLPDDRTVHWRPPPAYLRMPALMNVLLNRLRLAGEKV